VCTGHVNFAEVVDHFRQLKEDPACLERMDVLLDVSNVDSLPDSNQIGAVGTALAAIRPKVQFGACSIVAAKDAMFGMMRMFEVRAGDYFGAVRVFRKAADAEIWLASQQAPAKSGE
jgi:hypothetical protein